MPYKDNAGTTSVPSLPKMQTAIEPQKFYMIDYKSTGRQAGIELVNRQELLGDGNPRTILPPSSFQRGFRTYPVRPRFRVSPKLGRKLYDIEMYGEYWLISDRARDVLQTVSRQDCAFLPVDTEVNRGAESVVLWFCDIITILDAVDESKSLVTIKSGGRGERVYHLWPPYKLVFDDNIVGTHKIFRMLTNISEIICADAMRSPIKRAGLTGLHFLDVVAS